MKWHFFLLKNYKIEFTHKKETKHIPIQTFILTRYQKKLHLQFDLQTTRERRGEREWTFPSPSCRQRHRPLLEKVFFFFPREREREREREGGGGEMGRGHKLLTKSKLEVAHRFIV